MHHSSIFSSETHKATWRLSYWLPLFVVFLLAAEVILRVPAVRQALPPPEPTLWHSALIQNKLDYLKEYAANNEVDVLFLGNSTTQAGVNPAVFDEVRQAAGGGAFNGSIEGLPPYGTLQFLKIYLRYATPKTVVIGLSPQDLNSESPWAKDVTERVEHSPMVTAEARDGLMGNVLAFLFDHSALFRYRFVLHQMLLRGGNTQEAPEAYFDARGYHPIDRSLLDFSPSEMLQQQNRAGLLNYTTQGLQSEALEEAIELAKAEGAQVILVNMPISDHYYTNFDSPATYARYEAALHALAEKHDVPVWDMEALAGAQGFGDAEFADFNHLNRVGADKLSTLLAQEYQAFTAAGGDETARN